MTKISNDINYNLYKLGYYEGKCEAYERILVKNGWLARVCDMYDKISINDKGEFKYETTK